MLYIFQFSPKHIHLPILFLSAQMSPDCRFTYGTELDRQCAGITAGLSSLFFLFNNLRGEINVLGFLFHIGQLWLACVPSLSSRSGGFFYQPWTFWTVNCGAHIRDLGLVLLQRNRWVREGPRNWGTKDRGRMKWERALNGCWSESAIISPQLHLLQFLWRNEKNLEIMELRP